MSRPLCQQSPHSAPSVERDDFQYPSQCFIGELHSADEADNGCLLLEHQPRACISEAAWCPEGPMVRTAASPSPGGNDQTCEQAQALAPIPRLDYSGTGITLKRNLVNASQISHACHCGRQFRRKEHLRRHQATHQTPAFICYVCSRPFSRKSVPDVSAPGGGRARRARGGGPAAGTGAEST